ncbi:MAG: M20/M25/M40 family metallo-hydrolase [Candidatus Tectomicrobia bacterium]|nr:M20/M25/M40 family metallo-hydrolase [Candidatus Tectomicrobia bacterium]
MSKQSGPDKVVSRIHRDEVVDLAVALGNIPSPTGEERAIGDFLFEWLRKEGFRPFKQRVADGRENVVASLPGKGGGKSLIFNAHMDTFLWAPHDIWVEGEEKPHFNGAWAAEGKVYGHGVVNDKGPMAAFLIAAKALRESGVPLPGDVILTMVVGEIGGAPVDEYQGSRYLGKGVGTRHLLDHGVFADCALVAEATDFGLTWAECGALYVKITTRGRRLYTPYIERAHRPEESPNALVKMARLVLALEEWAAEYEKKNVLPIEVGEIRPRADVGAIRSGLPFRPSCCPAVCSCYLDVRLLPEAAPQPIIEDLRAMAQGLGIAAEFEVYLHRPGYIGKNVERLRGALEKAHQQVHGKKIGGVAPPVTSMWRDVNLFNAVGIPAITYGPGAGAGGGSTFFLAEDLARASQVYALTAVHACG